MRLILTGHHLTAITSSAHGFDTEYTEVPFDLAVTGSLVVERESKCRCLILWSQVVLVFNLIVLKTIHKI